MEKGSSGVKIGILSLTEREDINHFVEDHQQPGKIDLCKTTLEFEDLLKYKPSQDWNAVILLHSAKLGRLSLTDVPDARYDRLLDELNRNQEIKLIFVIAHDVNFVNEQFRKDELRHLEITQKTVFKLSENVVVCDTLNTLPKEDLTLLHNFFGNVYRKVTGEKLSVEHKDEVNQGDVTEGEVNQGDVAEGEVNQGEVNQVLVTDALGFIAAHIVQKLAPLAVKVRGMIDVQEETLDSFDVKDMKENIEKLKQLCPKIELCDAHFGWEKAVKGCTHVIHTSRFQEDRPPREDDVTKLLQACQDDKGITQIVLTGGFHDISEDELLTEEWKSVNGDLRDAICKHASKDAGLKYMGFPIEKELWRNEWKSMSSALKDAIYKYVSEKAARRFMGRDKELSKKELTFGLSIIKPSVVLGPILCELAEANVEIVRRRMVNASSSWPDISIPVCDVRDVAKAHIMALDFEDAGDIHVSDGVVPQRLSLKDMAGILEGKFKDQGYDFSSWSFSWDSMGQCLRDLYAKGNKSGVQRDRPVLVNDPIGKEKSVIDMAYSCIERGFIPKMPGYRPREEGKRNREETTGAYKESVQRVNNRDF